MSRNLEEASMSMGKLYQKNILHPLPMHYSFCYNSQRLDLVLNKETKVTNGIKGHQHREKNVLPKQYFQIHEENHD